MLAGVVPIALQGFDAASMKYVASKSTVPLVQLISMYHTTVEAAWNEEVLDDCATYSVAVAPSKSVFTADGVTNARAVEMASWAHDRGLAIIPYTLKPETSSIDTVRFRNDPYKELAYYYDYLQCLAVFHEAPDMAREHLSSHTSYP
jgi:glycerophosphoryl diester phosphodiesterase